MIDLRNLRKLRSSDVPSGSSFEDLILIVELLLSSVSCNIGSDVLRETAVHLDRVRVTRMVIQEAEKLFC